MVVLKISVALHRENQNLASVTIFYKLAAPSSLFRTYRCNMNKEVFVSDGET
jgi:hypothetical protein